MGQSPLWSGIRSSESATCLHSRRHGTSIAQFWTKRLSQPILRSSGRRGEPSVFPRLSPHPMAMKECMVALESDHRETGIRCGERERTPRPVVRFEIIFQLSIPITKLYLGGSINIGNLKVLRGLSSFPCASTACGGFITFE